MIATELASSSACIIHLHLVSIHVGSHARFNHSQYSGHFSIRKGCVRLSYWLDVLAQEIHIDGVATA